MKHRAELYQYALRLLARRDYALAEMRKKLVTRLMGLQAQEQEGDGCGEEGCHKEESWRKAEGDPIEVVLSRLIELDYLSDARFAEQFVRAKQSAGFGPYRITQQLTEKGISPLLIKQHLDPSDAGWVDQAIELLEKKCRSHRSSGPTSSTYPHTLPYKEKAKLTRYLIQKGFSYDQINTAFDAFRSVNHDKNVYNT